MKVRTGFVSNSSSSSFIIGVKGRDLPNEKELAKLFGVSEEAILWPIALKLADIFLNVENVADDKWFMHALTDDPIHYKWEKEKLDNGWKLYQGSCSDTESGIEALGVSIGLNYESVDLIIKKGAFRSLL